NRTDRSPVRGAPLATLGAGAVAVDRHQSGPRPGAAGRRERGETGPSLADPGRGPVPPHRRMSIDWVEGVGYLASLLVVLSLAQTRVLWLRLLSLSGSVVFTTYGLLIDSWPLVITNSVIVILNLYFLWRIQTGREEFSLLELAPDSPYLIRFLE